MEMVKKIFFAALIIFLFAGIASALPVPNYKGRVNDFAGMLKSDQVAQLEKNLERYEAETSNQIAILTIPSLEGDDLEGFSIRVAEKWKVGQKGKDNGVLILVALVDRKMRIEVGRGLEGGLTDLVAGRIVDSVMKPAFKKEEYYKGLSDTIGAVQLAIKGEFKAETSADNNSSESEAGAYLLIYGFLFFVAGILGLIHFLMGGIVGGAGAFFLTSWLFSPGLLILIAVSVGGFLIGMMAHLIVSGIAESSGGGSYSGGGFSGGGGSSFSFGGGGFGGGGASGGW